VSEAAHTRNLQPVEPLQRRLRIWGAVLAAWGIVHFIGYPAMSRSWGLVFVIAGAAAFVFDGGGLFAGWAALLSWAALANLLTGRMLNVVNGAVQAFLAISALFAFRGSRAWRGSERAAPQATRAGRVLPWASLLSGSASVGGSLALLVAGYLVLRSASGQMLPAPYDELRQAAADLGALGLGAGVAALACGARRRWPALLGIATSLLVLASQLLLGVLLLQLL
jgi:hypothetical protein